MIYYSSHIDLYLDGVEIVVNSSGSHHELRKAGIRADLVKNATSKVCHLHMLTDQCNVPEVVI